MNPNSVHIIMLVLIVSLSCNPITQTLPATVPATDDNSRNISANPTSAVSVGLEWQAVDGATMYELEARYGSREFFPIASLASDVTNFEHFVVPGSTSLTYRVTATTDSSEQVVGTATVSMPQVTPDPLVVQIQPALPEAFSELLTDPNAVGTVDPNNFDPNNFDPNNFDPNQFLPPGMDLSDLENLDPESLLKGIQAEQEIGPDGGEIVLTGPDGVIYTLTVPPGALDQTVLFNLYAVGGIDGLPMSAGLLGAAQIVPQVQFHLPSTLTIKLPETKSVPAEAMIVGFSISRFLNEFSLQPVTTEDETSFSLSINWGDTFGISTATPQEIKAQAIKIPTDESSQMAQLIAVLRSQNLAAGSEALIYDQLIEGLLDQLDQLAFEYPVNAQTYNATYPISAQPASARGSGPFSTEAKELARAIAHLDKFWERYNLGDDNRRSEATDRMRSELIAKIKAFIKKTEKACLTPDTMYAGSLIGELRYGRENVDSSQSFWAWLAKEYGPIGDIYECNFKLEITSSISAVEPHVTWAANANTITPINMRLSYRDKGLFLTGVGVMKYGGFTGKVAAACGIVVFTDVPNIDLMVRLDAVFNDAGVLKDFSITQMEPTQTILSPMTVNACGKRMTHPASADWWAHEFLYLRTMPGGAVIDWKSDKGFGVGAPDVFRRIFNNFTASDGYASYTENTSFIFTVTPRYPR